MDTVFTKINEQPYQSTQSDINQLIQQSASLVNIGAELTNDMTTILENADAEIDKYKNLLDINDDTIELEMNRIQWNYYYYKRYKKLNEILRVFIVVCILLIILSRLQSPYFDNTAYTTITGFIIAMLFLYIMYSLWDLFIRDNINFDEYDFAKYDTGVPKDYDPNKHSDVPAPPHSLDYDISGCMLYRNAKIASSTSPTS